MMEKSGIYISDNRQLFPVPKTEMFGDSLEPSDSYYQKKEKEVVIIKKDLPADHLTATYWG
jgi:hypothetical protein